MIHLGLDTECSYNSNIAILKVLMDVCTQGISLEITILVSGVDLMCILS